MSNIKFIDLESQYLAYKDEINSEVIKTLESIKYISGPQLASLEKELQDFCGAQHAMGCSSGTDALLLAMLAADIKPGDEVITCSFTFVSTVEMICLLGATPVFVDINLSNGMLDPNLVEDAISPRSKLIIPVSLFGQSAPMDEINTIAAKYSLKVIEDAAQSFGSIYKNRHSCAISDYACTSFYPAKGLGCYGDGGAVFARDEKDAQRIRSLINHGQSERYEYVDIGINGRLDDIQAAILRVKLRHYPVEIRRRRELAQKYDELLQDKYLSFRPLKIEPHNKSVYSQYSLYAAEGRRDEIRAKLQEAGIPSVVYYPKPLHMHKVFSEYASGRDLPFTEEAASRIFSIPVHPFLKDEEQLLIIDALIKI